jgi:hypothetical protein
MSRKGLFIIDQFNQVTGADGSEKELSLSQIGLNFACRHCHVEGGPATPKSDEERMAKASGYHTRP